MDRRAYNLGKLVKLDTPVVGLSLTVPHRCPDTNRLGVVPVLTVFFQVMRTVPAILYCAFGTGSVLTCLHFGSLSPLNYASALIVSP